MQYSIANDLIPSHSKRMVKDKESSKRPPPIPNVPEGWTRCHAWLPKKMKYCRQKQVPPSTSTGDKGSCYCGNHRHEYQASPCNRKRIPCPMDPSHWIYEDSVEKYAPICTKIKRQKLQESQPFYRQDLNGGGHGNLGDTTIPKETLDGAKNVALRVLRLHQKIFANTEGSFNVVAS